MGAAPCERRGKTSAWFSATPGGGGGAIAVAATGDKAARAVPGGRGLIAHPHSAATSLDKTMRSRPERANPNRVPQPDSGRLRVRTRPSTRPSRLSSLVRRRADQMNQRAIHRGHAFALLTHRLAHCRALNCPRRPCDAFAAQCSAHAGGRRHCPWRPRLSCRQTRAQQTLQSVASGPGRPCWAATGVAVPGFFHPTDPRRPWRVVRLPWHFCPVHRSAAGVAHGRISNQQAPRRPRPAGGGPTPSTPGPGHRS